MKGDDKMAVLVAYASKHGSTQGSAHLLRSPRPPQTVVRRTDDGEGGSCSQWRLPWLASHRGLGSKHRPGPGM